MQLALDESLLEHSGHAAGQAVAAEPDASSISEGTAAGQAAAAEPIAEGHAAGQAAAAEPHASSIAEGTAAGQAAAAPAQGTSLEKMEAAMKGLLNKKTSKESDDDEERDEEPDEAAVRRRPSAKAKKAKKAKEDRPSTPGGKPGSKAVEKDSAMNAASLLPGQQPAGCWDMKDPEAAKGMDEAGAVAASESAAVSKKRAADVVDGGAEGGERQSKAPKGKGKGKGQSGKGTKGATAAQMDKKGAETPKAKVPASSNASSSKKKPKLQPTEVGRKKVKPGKVAKTELDELMDFPGDPVAGTPTLSVKGLFVIYTDMTKGAYRYRRIGDPSRTDKAFPWKNDSARKAWDRVRFFVYNLYCDAH